MQHTPKHNHNPQVCTTLPLTLLYGCRTSPSSGPSHLKYRSDQYLSIIQEATAINQNVFHRKDLIQKATTTGCWSWQRCFPHAGRKPEASPTFFRNLTFEKKKKKKAKCKNCKMVKSFFEHHKPHKITYFTVKMLCNRHLIPI